MKPTTQSNTTTKTNATTYVAVVYVCVCIFVLLLLLLSSFANNRYRHRFLDRTNPCTYKRQHMTHEAAVYASYACLEFFWLSKHDSSSSSSSSSSSINSSSEEVFSPCFVNTRVHNKSTFEAVKYSDCQNNIDRMSLNDGGGCGSFGGGGGGGGPLYFGCRVILNRIIDF